MSQENVESLKALYKQWARGDWADASIFDPYVVAVLPDPTPRPHYGLEALAGYMERFLAGWDDMRMEATNYRDGENSVVVAVRRSATGKGSRVPVEDRAFHVWTFRGRRAIRLEVFDGESEALEAAGLSE